MLQRFVTDRSIRFLDLSQPTFLLQFYKSRAVKTREITILLMHA